MIGAIGVEASRRRMGDLDLEVRTASKDRRPSIIATRRSPEAILIDLQHPPVLVQNNPLTHHHPLDLPIETPPTFANLRSPPPLPKSRSQTATEPPAQIDLHLVLQARMSPPFGKSRRPTFVEEREAVPTQAILTRRQARSTERRLPISRGADPSTTIV